MSGRFPSAMIPHLLVVHGDACMSEHACCVWRRLVKTLAEKYGEPEASMAFSGVA